MAKPGRPKKEKVIETPVVVVPVVEPVIEQISEAPVVVEEPNVEVAEIPLVETPEEPTPTEEIPEIPVEVKSRDAQEGCAISYAPVTPQVTHPIMLQLNG